MATIYISYKLEDRDLVKQLADELGRLGHQSIYDAIALAPGANWRQVLLDSLSDADAMVVLLSERALGSPFVMGEIGAARALFHVFNHLLLLPVIVGDLSIPVVISDLFAYRMWNHQEEVVRVAKEISLSIEDHQTKNRLNYPRIFISHRHHDNQVAQGLVKVIEAAFEVKQSDLRCTSVHPYRLKAGDRTSDRLRAEILRAEAVLGILTPDTKDSSYVLFELGASWGRGGVTFPLLVKGATSLHVPAPIGDLHTLSLFDEGDCHQLLNDLADVITLNRQEENANVISQRINELVGLAK